jgi:hypothetical protein
MLNANPKKEEEEEEEEQNCTQQRARISSELKWIGKCCNRDKLSGGPELAPLLHERLHHAPVTFCFTNTSRTTASKL